MGSLGDESSQEAPRVDDQYCKGREGPQKSSQDSHSRFGDYRALPQELELIQITLNSSSNPDGNPRTQVSPLDPMPVEPWVLCPIRIASPRLGIPLGRQSQTYVHQTNYHSL